MGSFITFLACAIAGTLELIAALVLFFKARTGKVRIRTAAILLPPLAVGLMCLYFPFVSYLTRNNPSYLAGDQGWAPVLGTLMMICFTGALVVFFELLLLLKHWEMKSGVSTPVEDSGKQTT